MNSKAKMKKNLVRLVCLVLAAIMLIGCFAYFTMEEVETHDYSAGLTEEGFFEGVTALDNVVLPDYTAYTIPEDATIATEDEINAEYDNLAKTYGMDVEAVKKAIPAESLAGDIKSKKAIDFVKDNAKVTEEKVAAKKTTKKAADDAEKPAKKPAAKKTTKKAADAE